MEIIAVVFIALIFFVYIYQRGQSKFSNLNTKLDEIDESFDEIAKMIPLFYDLIQLNSVKALMKENPNKYDFLGSKLKKKDKNAGKALNDWAKISKATQVYNRIISKMNKCKTNYLFLFKLWPRLQETYRHTPDKLDIPIIDIYNATNMFKAILVNASDNIQNEEFQSIENDIDSVNPRMEVIVKRLQNYSL